MTDPLAAYTIAERLRICAYNRVAATVAGAPPRSCVITGEIAWDDCECGQLIVAITNSFASNNFPTPAISTALQFGASRCGHPIIVFEMTITMLRCVPGGGANGEAPSCTSLASAAQIAVIDAAAVRDGVLCCLSAMQVEKNASGVPTITGFTAGGQQFIGPQGNCGGSAMDVQVGVLSRCPC